MNFELDDDGWDELGKIISKSVRNQIVNGVTESPLLTGFEVVDKRGNKLQLVFKMSINPTDKLWWKKEKEVDYRT